MRYFIKEALGLIWYINLKRFQSTYLYSFTLNILCYVYEKRVIGRTVQREAAQRYQRWFTASELCSNFLKAGMTPTS